MKNIEFMRWEKDWHRIAELMSKYINNKVSVCVWGPLHDVNIQFRSYPLVAVKWSVQRGKY